MEVTTSKAAAVRGFVERLSTVEGRLLRLEVVVLLSAILLAALVLYGTTRRRSSDKLLRGVMWMAYSLSYVVVSYAVGLIQDGPFRGETFVLWAAALLLIQASAYAAPVHSRREFSQRKKLLLQHILQTALVLWLIVSATGRNASYRAAIWAFWCLNVLKTTAKIVEMIKASLPDLSVKVVAEYMDVEESLAAGDQPANPMTMKGYKYIFHGEDTMVPVSHEGNRRARDEMMIQSAGKSVVTIDRVYRWIDGEEGYSEVEKDMARDFCLAFALFKLLKRRFYGFVPAEVGSQKARDLVCAGLIHRSTTGPDAAFRVVEAELAFLYDEFYTRNIVLVGARTYVCIAAAVAGLTMWTAFFGTLGPAYHRLLIGVRDLDRSVTVLIVMITAGLELCQAVAGFSSNWRYVKTVYRCVRDDQPWSKRRRGHLWWKESITPPATRYWEDKVGQYVLLKRFNHRPWNILSWLTLYLVEPRRQGQKRGQRKHLPPEVRRAVLVSLKASYGHLTNGVSTMRRHGLSSQLEWACSFPKLTDQILVWHVVTTRCDWASGGGRSSRDDAADVNRLVARKLSNYCAYLVAFVPEMLPDPSYNAEQIFDTAVQQARDHLDGCRTESCVLARLQEIEDKERGDAVYERAGSSTIIEKAALLGGQLRAAVDAEERRWQVLAEFWAEFILFLAPSDNVDIHAEMLGAGGEFMTQLWALLSHAGVLERPPWAPTVPTV
ncbi:hypothetical protein E2562_015990 [Oryza meyeriana var. granulata]|uniref:DUF4220 domain-containing protein n=1 Tax=Oryza meyeriana var. granulata TaxID=110450 RepID=A0A6G1EKM1_9ORYZ|nr:hypothetical protein E2562_015990 [Oryza meyeriana var. granulata]